MENALTDFLHYCRVERRLAPLTCSAYERDVTACLRFLQSEGVSGWGAVRPADLRRFLADEATRRPAPSSQARTVAALKGFFRFLLENEEIERDPAAVLRTPKKREALPDVLDRRELARLLGTVERDDVWERHFAGKRERDRLLLTLFAYAGLRRGELLGLDWDDVDLERRLLHIRHAKGGRERVVPIHPALAPLFIDYLAVRGRNPEPALFVGVQGRRLSQTIMTQTFLRYARAAGVTERKRVTPHTLRHVFASELLRAGANLRQIQELLGHKHLDSTQRYTRVTAHELRGAIKRLRFARGRLGTLASSQRAGRSHAKLGHVGELEPERGAVELTERQLRIAERLDALSSILGDLFRAAVRQLRERGDEAWVRLTAHACREIVNRVPDYLDLPVAVTRLDYP